MSLSYRHGGSPFVFALVALATASHAGGCSAVNEPTEFGEGGQSATSSSGPSSSVSGTGGAVDLAGATGTGGGSSSPGVPQTCAEAVEAQSYIGCEYWPTVTSNGSLYSGFEFAIVASNPTATMADVAVERGGAPVQKVSVSPGDLQVIVLPWVMELKQDDPAGNGSGLSSALVPGGAYKVTSSVPITLYQFNPLEFSLPSIPADCPLAIDYGGCFSFTNDASLLLPKTALRNEYLVMSYPTLHIGQIGTWIDLPGFVAITATEDDTHVTFTTKANVRAGTGVAVLTPGEQGAYTLQAGDVLMLDSAAAPPQETPLPNKPCENDLTTGTTKCPTAPEYDLTGSRIVADKPVSVIGGHDCSFMPFDRFACDHMEESLFPLETLGNDLIVTAPQAVQYIGSSSKADSMFIRVLSAADANEITFDPPVAANVTLNAGEWTEIGPIATDVRVKAKDKIMVGQYMVGEDFTGTSAGAGDPSESIAIPTEQYRLEYTFFAPSTYTYNFVNVVTKTGTGIEIDGTPIPPAEFVPIGGTEYAVARHQIQGGSHRMKGNSNFGIVVYGYGQYTSYMYPGGLNLETIRIVPE